MFRIPPKKRGRPRAILSPDTLDIAKLLQKVFSQRDLAFGDYWDIFSTGPAEEIQSLCKHLCAQGYSVFLSQCDVENPDTFAARIVKGRNHPKFPQRRRDAQIAFLAQYSAIGRFVSPKTWKRTTTRWPKHVKP